MAAVLTVTNGSVPEHVTLNQVATLPYKKLLAYIGKLDPEQEQRVTFFFLLYFSRCFFFFISLDGPSRPLCQDLSDTQVYEPVNPRHLPPT